MKMLLNNILLKNANSNPKKPAVIDTGTHTICTYDELNASSNRLAHALTDAGVSKGDRVAIVQHNCLEYIVAFFAVSKIGAVLATFDYRLAPRELMYLLNDSRANTLIIGENYLDLIRPIRSEISTVRNFICIGQSAEDMQGYNELTSIYPTTEPVAKIDENDLATLYYTSGTTGLPKGVMMTHKNLAAAMMNMLKVLPVTSDDITLHTSPFSHIAPIWPLLDHCYVGGGNVILRRVEPGVVLEAISEYKVTTWNTVPTMILRLIEYPELDRYDLSSLRWIGYGASPMPIEVLKKAILKLGNIFTQVYGATETYIVNVFPKEDHVLNGPESRLRRLRSCGKPLDGFEVRIVNEQNKDIEPGETGEIIVKGDSVTTGYWGLPEETANTIKQGWYYTGDLATVDEEGYIYIIDRKKEIIISGGENISPREIEEIIYKHPSVFEVAVIGVPDEKWVEAVKAVVVLKEGKTATGEEIIAFCKKNMASFKAPKSVDFTDSLPKTLSGKISRKEIKGKYWARDM
jgi:acyl-CoA synthetase (AMP-forming)/AMP-acid ligase II